MLAATVIVAPAFSFSGGDEPFPGFTKDKSGTYFLFHVKGTGTATVDTGGAIFVKVKFVTDYDSVFLDINASTQTPSYPMRIDAPAFPGDFLDMFTRLHVGDSASFFVNLDSLKKYYPDEFNFGATIGARFDEMRYLGFAVKVDSIYTRHEVQEMRAALEAKEALDQERLNAVAKEEPAAMDKYISENKIKTKPSPSGLYYVEHVKGKGEPVKPGQLVSLTYTCKYLDGTIVDATDPGKTFDFRIDQGQVIPGFNEGVRQMKVGGKATLIIPSWLAYGADSTFVRPYATLIYEVEIVAVND